MKKQIGISLEAITILLFTIHMSAAGVVIEQQMKDKEGKATQVVLYCSEDQLRTDHPESGLTTILDFKGDQILLIDHRSKGYLLMKLSQWEKEMAKELNKNNPAIRPKERVITVKRFGETVNLNGVNTEKIQVFADGELIEEHWVAKDIDMGEADRVMEKATQELSKGFQPELKEGQEIYKKVKPYGFSVLVKDYTITHGLGAIDILEVKKIERKELKDEVFLPPEGYEKIVPQPLKK
jgi:hypothetical protein